jgi:hypothetical protein
MEEMVERLKRIATARSCTWSPTLTRRIAQCAIIMKEVAGKRKSSLNI